MTIRRFCLFIVLTIAVSACTVSGESISNRSDKKMLEVKKCLFCDAVTGVDMNGYKLQEAYKKDWYAYDVNFDQGFNPLFVPFEYSSVSGDSDPEQKLTFPTLLSIKFDFVDNNICTRHPAFIYQRDKDILQLTIDDTDKVIEKMHRWGQNIAIGGTITQDGAMYSGFLKIINKDRVLMEQQFKKSDYFELMGKMVLAWIEFSGAKVTNGLKSELMRPMTSSKSAIKKVGESFKVERRSKAQWDIFERILEIDPDFAEIRWWYANQKWWQTKDDKWQASMMLTALESHLVVPALREAEYQSAEDFYRRYNVVFSRAKNILPNHWVVLLQSYDNKWADMSLRDVKKLANVAFERPYAYSFCTKVSKKIYNNYDYQISVPLMLSIINSRYNPGEGHLNEFQRLVYSFYSLGYMRDSIALLRPMFRFTKDKARAALYAGYVMDEIMESEQAINFFQIASKGDNDKKLAVEFLINAFLDAGLTDRVREIMQSKDWNIISDDIKPVFNGRLYQKEGKSQEAKRLLSIAKNKITGNGYHKQFLETSLYELQLEEKDEAIIQTIDRLWSNSPRSRRTYHLFKKVHSNNTSKMQAYLNVMTHLFPNQVYWKDEAKQYMPFPEPSTDELIKKLGHYGVMMFNKSSKIISGFEFENICLGLLKKDPEKYFYTVKVHYRGYAYNAKNISLKQRAHRRAFYSLLKKMGKGPGTWDNNRGQVSTIGRIAMNDGQ
jgi:hypothetical protein